LRFVNSGVVAIGREQATTWVGKAWAFLAEEGLPERWLLVGLDGGVWAVTVDDGEPARSGVLIARSGG
jgi:hypothetical protein